MLKSHSAAMALVALGPLSFFGCSSSGGNATPDGGAGTGGAAGTPDSGGGTGGNMGSGGNMPVVDSMPPMTDAGGDTAGDATSTGCGAYQLCDDFEGTAPGAAGSPWTYIMKGYTVQLVTTQAHSGTHSVQATATAGAGYAYIMESKMFPATDFWLRAYLRIMAPSGGHEVFLGSDTNLNEAMGDQVRYLNNGGGGKIATNSRSKDTFSTSPMAIPMGSWFCYEVHQTPTGASIYLEGTELPEAKWTNAEPTFVALVLGFERFGGGQPGDIWIDDVAINSTQVGCK